MKQGNRWYPSGQGTVAAQRERYGSSGGRSLRRRLRPHGRAEFLTGLVAVCLMGGGVFMSQLPVAAAPTASGIMLDQDGSGRASGGPLSSAQARALWAGWEQLTAGDPEPPREVGVLPRPTPSSDVEAEPAQPAQAVPGLPTSGTGRLAGPTLPGEPQPAAPAPAAPQQPVQRPAEPGPIDLAPTRPNPQEQTPVATPHPAPSTPAPAPSPLAPSVPSPEAPSTKDQPATSTDSAGTQQETAPANPATPSSSTGSADVPHPEPTH